MKYHAVVGLMFLGARVVAAQDPQMHIPGDREASAQIARIVAAADAAGLPTDLLVGKVQYGVRVSHSAPERIVNAVSTVATRLELARTALAPNATHPEIRAGADALSAEATTENLKAIRKAGGSRSVAAALGLLTQLLSNKVPKDSATKIVTDLVRKGATPVQLVAFLDDFNAYLLSSLQAVAATDVHTQSLTGVLAASAAAAAAADFQAAAVNSGVRSDPPKPRRP